MKTVLIILSVAFYFGMAAAMLNVGESLPDISSLPFKNIGVETIVQKSGQIPEKMVGAIFPHSNGPIYRKEVNALTSLNFVKDYDTGLFIWYFDTSFFKSALGVNTEGHVFSPLLKSNIKEGRFIRDSHDVILTQDFAQAHDLTIGNVIQLGNHKFSVTGILNPSPSGNIIPADMYLKLAVVQDISVNSGEMRSIYKFANKDFVNVVTIKSDPRFKGDKEKAIKALGTDYLVFSEKTFSKEIENQIAIISSFGKIMFIILGFIIIILFSLLTFYNLKTREGEIAVLRIIGWPTKKLKLHFITESLILLVAGIIIGNLLATLGLFFISSRSVTMELPWEMSAIPHFLPHENSINRTITSRIPIHFDLLIFVLLIFAFITMFGIIIVVLFRRIKRVKPLKNINQR
jgi:ABC-type lipoprotein release transport system permease subunit